METNTLQFEQNEDHVDRTEEKPLFWFLPDFEKNPDIPRPLLLWHSLKNQYPDILKYVSAAAVNRSEGQSKGSSALISLSEWAFITAEFFAYINDSRTRNFPELQITMDSNRGILSIPIKLDPQLTLKEALRIFREANGEESAILKEYNDVVVEWIAPLLSMLLYICSDKPEIDNFREPGTAPSRVTLKKVKKGFRFFVPSEQRIWVVGEKTGEAIRKYATSGGHGKSKRPHLRRAHWHGYWRGKKGRQEFRPAWLSPITVNADWDEKAEKSLFESRSDPSEVDNHSKL
jgi:hypothetical protein